MSNAVKIAGITITVRLEVVRLYATAMKKEKDRRRTAILQRSKKNNFNLILDKFRRFVKEEFKNVSLRRLQH